MINPTSSLINSTLVSSSSNDSQLNKPGTIDEDSPTNFEETLFKEMFPKIKEKDKEQQWLHLEKKQASQETQPTPTMDTALIRNANNVGS